MYRPFGENHDDDDKGDGRGVKESIQIKNFESGEEHVNRMNLIITSIKLHLLKLITYLIKILISKFWINSLLNFN